MLYTYVLKETAYKKLNSQIAKNLRNPVLGKYNLLDYFFSGT